MFYDPNYLLINKIFLLLISLTTLWIAFWVYLADRKNKINRLFFLTTLSLLFWWIGGYFFSFSDNLDFSLFLGKIILGEVSISFTLVYFFITFFPYETKRNKIFEGIIILSALVFFLLSIYTNLIVESTHFTKWGVDPIYGRGQFFYYGWIALLMAMIFIKIFKKYIKAPKEIRTKIQYFFTGFLIFVLMNLIFNVIFPLWKDSIQYWQLGNYAAIFLLGFTAYAIVKRELFGIRIILTTLLVSLITILLGLDIFVFTPQLLFKLFKGLVLVIFLYFGYLLIKSVLREIEMRERVRRAYEVEKKARKQIEELTKAKTQFIMATQHHLRTPLTSMIGYLDLLFGGTYGKFSPKIKTTLLKFQVSTRRLIRVVNALLDISQFQMGKKVVTLEPGIKFEDLIKEVIEELQFEIDNRGLYLNLSKAAKLPTIKADAEKLKVALFNIIDNAIKYTRQGGIIITLQSKAAKLLVSIKDTGIGIESEQAKKLFKSAFERGTEAKKVHGFGRGIGVYVTGHIIRAHNGKIWAESEGEDKGSTFFIELPVG